MAFPQELQDALDNLSGILSRLKFVDDDILFWSLQVLRAEELTNKANALIDFIKFKLPEFEVAEFLFHFESRCFPRSWFRNFKIRISPRWFLSLLFYKIDTTPYYDITKDWDTVTITQCDEDTKEKDTESIVSYYYSKSLF